MGDLIGALIIVGGIAVLLVMIRHQIRWDRRDAQHRNASDGGIVIEPLQKTERKPRGRVDDNDRPSNLKGW